MSVSQWLLPPASGPVIAAPFPSVVQFDSVQTYNVLFVLLALCPCFRFRAKSPLFHTLVFATSVFPAFFYLLRQPV